MVNGDKSVGFTTNEEDQRKAAELQARLAENVTRVPSNGTIVPSVKIDEGAHKYVLIKANEPESGESKHFVTSRRGAAYHRNAAEPFVKMLEENGYSCIEILGGGRIFYDEESKKISIFGYSYGFGKAEHAVSKDVILSDIRYRDHEVTWSNDGY